MKCYILFANLLVKGFPVNKGSFRVISNAGEIPKNHDILREAYSLCYRLPVLNTDKFKEDFFNVSIL